LILVDSSVWIDHFRNLSTPATERLDDLLNTERVWTGDLIVTEVLQGFSVEREFHHARRVLTTLPMVEIAGADTAVEAAMNYRRLRERGVTVRKTIDTLIATRCLVDNYALLYSDRDFDGFVAHLGLRSALPGLL
jgi:hypothetical protein